MRTLQRLCLLTAIAGACASAEAYEFRCRFVERVGNTDVVLTNNQVVVSSPFSRNFRVQFGVFDDAVSAAPAGGFVGWNVGTLTTAAPANAWNLERNPGRLAPWNFASGPFANGNPAADPFVSLTDIDATLGTQSPSWVCGAGGVVPTQPAPTIRGLNTFVSVFAFRLNPGSASGIFTITAAGNVIGASGWQTVGTPTPPDCGDPANPGDDTPGSVLYAPVPVTPQSISRSLIVYLNEPAPGAALTLACGGGVLAARRRRR